MNKNKTMVNAFALLLLSSMAASVYAMEEVKTAFQVEFDKADKAFDAIEAELKELNDKWAKESAELTKLREASIAEQNKAEAPLTKLNAAGLDSKVVSQFKTDLKNAANSETEEEAVKMIDAALNDGENKSLIEALGTNKWWFSSKSEDVKNNIKAVYLKQNQALRKIKELDTASAALLSAKNAKAEELKQARKVRQETRKNLLIEDLKKAEFLKDVDFEKQVAEEKITIQDLSAMHKDLGKANGDYEKLTNPSLIGYKVAHEEKVEKAAIIKDLEKNPEFQKILGKDADVNKASLGSLKQIAKMLKDGTFDPANENVQNIVNQFKKVVEPTREEQDPKKDNQGLKPTPAQALLEAALGKDKAADVKKDTKGNYILNKEQADAIAKHANAGKDKDQIALAKDMIAKSGLSLIKSAYAKFVLASMLTKTAVIAGPIAALAIVGSAIAATVYYIKTNKQAPEEDAANGLNQLPAEQQVAQQTLVA